MSASQSILARKVAIISGAATGIGRATAVLLASKGVSLVLNGRRADVLNKAADELKAEFKCKVIAVPGDVSKLEDVKLLVKTACDEFGKLDVFVSNAGIMPTSMMDQLQVEDWNATIDINIKSLTNAIAAALPVFQEQKSGHFVTVASTAGLKVVPTMAVYAGSKHAVRAIMDGLRQEVGPDIRATTICPGVTSTEGVSSSIAAMKDEAQSKQMAAFVKIGMNPSAVARCIVFAMEQPTEVNIGEIVVRPTAQK